jgi:hypothetical protein
MQWKKNYKKPHSWKWISGPSRAGTFRIRSRSAIKSISPSIIFLVFRQIWKTTLNLHLKDIAIHRLSIIMDFRFNHQQVLKRDLRFSRSGLVEDSCVLSGMSHHVMPTDASKNRNDFVFSVKMSKKLSWTVWHWKCRHYDPSIRR